MAVQFRNREDNRRYAAAEDAFTSEGGYLVPLDELPRTQAVAYRETRLLSRDFIESMGRYATGMRDAVTGFRRGGAHPATRATNPTAR